MGSPSKSRSKSRSNSKSSSKEHAKGKGESSNSIRSDESTKAKRLLKASERNSSKKADNRLSDSDSDDEYNRVQEKNKRSLNGRTLIEKKASKKANAGDKSSEESTWRDEFDDGLGEDFIGEGSDREKMESMTEKEREEEIFKRAEKREELKKRFEISQKLKLQLKDNKVPLKEKSDGELSSDDDVKKEVDSESRKKGYEVKHAAKFSALSQLKAKRE